MTANLRGLFPPLTVLLGAFGCVVVAFASAWFGALGLVLATASRDLQTIESVGAALRITSTDLASALGATRTPTVEGDSGPLYFETHGNLALTLLLVLVLSAAYRFFVLPRLAPLSLRQSVSTGVGTVLFALVAFVVTGIVARGPRLPAGAAATSGGRTWDVSVLSGRGLWFALLLATLAVLLAHGGRTIPRTNRALNSAAGLGRGVLAALVASVRLVGWTLVAATTLVMVTILAVADPEDRWFSELLLGTTTWTHWTELATLAAGTAAAVHGMTIGSLFGERAQVGVIEGGVGVWFYLAPLLLALTALVVGARAALSVAASRAERAGLALLPLTYLAVWLMVEAIASTSLRNTNDGDPFLFVGVTAGSLIGLALMWGTLAAVTGLLASVWLPNDLPRTAALLAGRRIHPDHAQTVAARLGGRGKPIPTTVLAAAGARDAPRRSAAIRRVGRKVSASLVVPAGLAALALLVLPSVDPAYCSSPFGTSDLALRDMPTRTPPADVQSELDDLKAQLGAAEREQRAANRQLGPAQEYAETLQAARSEQDALDSQLASTLDGVAAAQRLVKRNENAGEFEREMLESAQETYDLFEGFDDDGYWLGELRDAEADLEDALAPLRRAQERLATATVRRDALTPQVQAAAAQVAQLEAGYGPFEAAIERSTAADTAVVLAAQDLDEARVAWDQEFADATVAAEANNDRVTACREWADSRSTAVFVAAAIALGALVGALLLRSPRRRVVPKA